MPGRSRSRFWAMMSSTGTKRRESPTRTKRGMPLPTGAFTRIRSGSLSFGWWPPTRRLSDRLEMNGNGCAGSSASGVTRGKMLRT